MLLFSCITVCRDQNVIDLCEKYGVDIAVSSGALRTLAGCIRPFYKQPWDIPFSVIKSQGFQSFVFSFNLIGYIFLDIITWQVSRAGRSFTLTSRYLPEQCQLLKRMPCSARFHPKSCLLIKSAHTVTSILAP